MDSQWEEVRDFREPTLRLLDDVVHSFSSSNEEIVQEHSFHKDINEKNSKLPTDIQSIEQFQSIFNSLEIEFERAERMNIHLEHQLILVKTIGEKLSKFSLICRSRIISSLNIRQNPSILTTQELQILTTYAPDSDSIRSDIVKTILEFSPEDYSHRLNYARSIIHFLEQTTRLRLRITALNELLIKSVLRKSEQSFHLPINLFNNSNSLYEIFSYEIQTRTSKHNVYIRSLLGQLRENQMNIICTENDKHPLAQSNYNLCEKYSYIFDIEFQRVITSLDQLTIALPCFSLPVEFQSTNTSSNRSQQQQQQISIRCKRIMDPLVHIPARIEIYNDISYAVFRLTHALSTISVEAVLFYPFEILNMSHEGSSSVYTSEYSSIFRLQTPNNYFLRSPRVRIIPFNNELIRCAIGLQSDDQLLASSDLIEFDWCKQTKFEGMISITIQLTKHFNLINEDLQQRRRRAHKKILFQREKFEQEKYDEAGGSLTTTPTSPTVMSHLPSISAILDHQASRYQPTFTLNSENLTQSNSSNKAPFKWKLDGFKNENAPLIFLGYKNRKWKNCNNFVSITPTTEKNTYLISLTILLDRIILIRCWPESNNEGKFDKLAENLWSLTSRKLFSCVFARDPSSVSTLGHYALVIVPIQKQNQAEDILRKRNYTEFIRDEPFISENKSKTQLSKTIEHESHHALFTRSSLTNIPKYVQFCLSEGTYVRIVPMGNIDVHEKVELSFRLHAQYPIVLEFDIYPIDIYRQKTDNDFIGTLNIYEINDSNLTLGSTSSTLTAPTISSRTSAGSKELEIFDGLPMNSSARTSSSGLESMSNSGVPIVRLTARDFNETNLVSIIRIRLPKTGFNLPSTQSNTIPVIIPNFFTGITQSLTEGKHEFAVALHIHPALMNPLFTTLSSQTRETDGHTTTPLSESPKVNLSKDDDRKAEQTKLENETLLKWLKRQHAFQTDQTIDNIISALIHIGRVDLAYTLKIDNLRNQCEDR